MVLTLERAGFIRRQPSTPRSIELLVDPKQCRSYFDRQFQPVKITVQRLELRTN
jgi:hypothetical protein